MTARTSTAKPKHGRYTDREHAKTFCRGSFRSMRERTAAFSRPLTVILRKARAYFLHGIENFQLVEKEENCTRLAKWNAKEMCE